MNIYGAEEKDNCINQIIHSERTKLKSLVLILFFVSNVCFAEPLNCRTNNAGNLTYSKYNNWDGQLGIHKGFVVFDTKDNGLRAMEIVLKSNIRKNNTVSLFVRRYTNESLRHKHIQNYVNAIRKHLGRDHLYTSDSEKLLPLIVFLEGGEKAFNYYFGVKNVRTKRNGSFDCFVQETIVINGLHRRSIKQVVSYSLRDVLL